MKERYLKILGRYKNKGLILDAWDEPLVFTHPIIWKWGEWYLITMLMLYQYVELRKYFFLVAIILSLPFFIMRGMREMLMDNLKKEIDDEIRATGIAGFCINDHKNIINELIEKLNSLRLKTEQIKKINTKGSETIYIIFDAKSKQYIKSGFGDVYLTPENYFIWRFSFSDKKLKKSLIIDNWSSPSYSGFSDEIKENRLDSDEKTIINLACYVNEYEWFPIPEEI
jgi:hypothetical protein